MSAALELLEKQIQVAFTDKTLLRAAFIHRSFLNEPAGRNLQSNERLEFLGDAVLELATSHYLFTTLPACPEGELTSLRSSLVKTTTLAELAVQLNLGSYLQMSRGEQQSGGRTNPSLLANTVEALIGALYLDQGFIAAQNFTQTFIFPKLAKIRQLNLHHDFKSTLQEKIQALGKNTPTYQTLSETGPAHQKIFTVAVIIDNQQFARGHGPTKQSAQMQAAQRALLQLASPAAA